MKNQDRSFLKNTFSPSEDKYYPNVTIDWFNWGLSLPFKFVLMKFDLETGSLSKITEPLMGGTFMTEIVLPIPPTNLRIATNVATSLTPTLEGVVEQHNGSPFRDITLQGVTGINLIKNNANPSPPSPLAVYGGALFPTVASAVANIQNSALSIAGSERFTHTAVNEDSEIFKESTGFFQFHALRSFLERYIELKKKNISLGSFNSKELRLVFANYKDEAFYVVSAVNFTSDRSAQDPLMYTYSIQLKAYRRIKSLEGISADVSVGLDRNYSTALNKLFVLLGSVSTIIESGSQGILGLVGDTANNLNNTLKSLNLLLKRNNNLAITLMDLPESLQNNIKQLSATSANSQKEFNRLNTKWNNTIAKYSGNTPASSLFPEGVGSKKDFLSTPIDKFALPKGFQDSLQKYIDQNSDQSIIDLNNQRLNLQNAVYEFTNSKGVAGEAYAVIYNKNYNEEEKELSLSDAKLLFAMNAMIQTFDMLAAKKLSDNSNTLPNTLQYVAGLAERSGMAFNIPVSKFAVPFPYGSTLERLSQRYLGDVNRWIEIAALNGLQAPYVDEEGWSYNLTSNGNGNLVYVNTREHINLGQYVYLVSNNVIREKRKVLNIRTISDTSFEFMLDGDPDLHRFTIAGLSKIEGFLPNTVNSQQVIFIPSATPSVDFGVFVDIPTVNMYDPLIQAAGVDLLLDETGDFILTEDGDTKLAYGLQNIVQGVNIAFSTEKGKIPQHPLFGAGVRPGTPTGDIRVTEIKNAAKNIFSDSNLFTGVSSLKIVKDGPVMRLTVVVGLKALGTNLPLTFILT